MVSLGEHLEGDLGAETQRGDGHVKMDMEIGVLCLQSKEHKGSQKNHQKLGEGRGADPPAQP